MGAWSTGMGAHVTSPRYRIYGASVTLPPPSYLLLCPTLSSLHPSPPRFLHILLFNAERAWAYAMELKKEVEKSMSLPKRNHLIRRLDKAHSWAMELSRVAGAGGCCDVQVGVGDGVGFMWAGALVAEAYAAWLGPHFLPHMYPY